MKPSLYLAFLCTLFYFSAKAQQPVNAELQQLVQAAFENYPRFRELEAGSETAVLRADLTRRQYLPNLNAQASARYIDPVAEAVFALPNAPEQKLKFQPNDNYLIDLAATGLLFDFGRTRAQIQRALAEADLSRGNEEALRHAVAYQVAQLYYGLVFTNRAIQVQQGQNESLQADLNRVQTRFNNGDALELDLLNAQVALANNRNRLADLQAQADKQRALLAQLTGSDRTVNALNFDFKPETSTASITHPELITANARITIAERELAVNKRFLRPSFTYSATTGFRNGYQPDIADFRFNWSVGINLAYPLYVGGRDRVQLRISEIGIRAAQAGAETVRRALASDLAQAEADARAARTKLAQADQITRQAEAALTIARSRFENGVATNVDVLTAQNNLEQARLATLQAQYQLRLAELSMSKAKGERFW